MQPLAHLDPSAHSLSHSPTRLATAHPAPPNSLRSHPILKRSLGKRRSLGAGQLLAQRVQPRLQALERVQRPLARRAQRLAAAVRRRRARAHHCKLLLLLLLLLAARALRERGREGVRWGRG